MLCNTPQIKGCHPCMVEKEEKKVAHGGWSPVKVVENTDGEFLPITERNAECSLQ